MNMNMNMGMCNSSYMEHKLLESGFTANIASGETYDLLITTTDKRSEYLNYIKKGQNGQKSSLCLRACTGKTKRGQEGQGKAGLRIVVIPGPSWFLT